ncbi:SRPBCC family protein [Flagellimonas sp. HMM57]|uniref:SRPBCC family protein n=1 Tax=unclassified Flagellimonas TaxID=2644544 RepID=UPI0013D5B432|nr:MULTISPECIES: SRPBCC family protein [unclassified Flagellimonas]UII76544.1 SRPBCC family protein [Flagellimonas sp. HMM57]
MKYTSEITVNLHREAFLEKLNNPEDMKHWQRDFIGYERLSEKPGEEGAQMSIHYEMGKRKFKMIETIIKNNLPEELHSIYDTKGVQNIQKNYFKEIGRKTKWISENEFIFSGFGMKLIGLFMPRAFKKQSKQYMEDFKAFAENNMSVLDF